ncbi:MAG: hypothetical protein OXJ53_07580 [Gammaproteobacteria bacterium]|nr:hypothetical protein [Gammaproteobacteria bacterium]MDE0272711.1 hypothetical protein [Gammaproteobacteria bacterium]
MKELTLKRDLEVWCGNVSGELAFGQKRDEVYAVACRMREVGETDANEIANHLLFADNPTQKRIAKRLLHICEEYGVIQSNRGRYALTEDGERVADSQQVLVPEKGAWTVWASQDPLLQHPVLDVKPFQDPSAYDEVRGKDKDSERSMRDTPDWLRELRNSPFEITASAKPARIDSIGIKAEPVESCATLRVDWAVGEGELRLVGKLGKREMDVALIAPENSPKELWRNLLESAGLWQDWDVHRQELRVFFEDTSEAERRSMVKRERITPLIPGLGSFDPLTLELRINAATPDDAQRWTEWRLVNGIDDYATSERYVEWARKAAQPFEHCDVRLPTRKELADDYPGAGDAPNWLVVAAEDWRL